MAAKKKPAKTEVEGLEAYIGQKITVYCCNYFYTGTLAHVGSESIRLTKAGIVYDTGDHKAATWSTYQDLPHDWNVMKASIEAFGIFK